MSDGTVLTRSFSAPPVSQKEILRYMGCREADGDLLDLIREIGDEAMPRFCYRVCFREAELRKNDGNLAFCGLLTESRDLARNLEGCARVVLFAATVGLEIDRLIAKYSRLSPSRAVILQALGAERVESLCDAFLEDLRREYEPMGVEFRPRFSPGYGDLPLAFQADLFGVLDCPRRIGLSLNQSFLMSPTKSVTAIVGLRSPDV